MRTLTSLTLAIVVLHDPLYGQDFALRHSAVDKNAVEKPAQFLITLPDEGESSYAINAAVSMSHAVLLIGNSLWDFSVAAEYHRNNQTDKEQNSAIASAGFLGVVVFDTNNSFGVLPQLTSRFKRDQVKHQSSLGAVLDLDLLWPNAAIGQIVRLAPCRALGVLWQPRAGLDFESVFTSPGDTLNGTVLRLYGGVELALYPLPGEAGEYVELYASIEGWKGPCRIGGRQSGWGRRARVVQRRSSRLFHVQPTVRCGMGIP